MRSARSKFRHAVANGLYARTRRDSGFQDELFLRYSSETTTEHGGNDLDCVGFDLSAPLEGDYRGTLLSFASRNALAGPASSWALPVLNFLWKGIRVDSNGMGTNLWFSEQSPIEIARFLESSHRTHLLHDYGCRGNSGLLESVVAEVTRMGDQSFLLRVGLIHKEKYTALLYAFLHRKS